MLNLYYCFLVSTPKYVIEMEPPASTLAVTNGVKQGGILSPLIFNIYIDDLSLTLSKSNPGCHLGGRCVNHIAYADDLCILSMSSSGIQNLLNICEKCESQRGIIYNSKKV